MKLLSILIPFTLLIGGCSMTPENIEVGEVDKLVTYVDSKQGDLAGRKARWGGKIVSVENKKDVSEIEIVYFPEARSGKPRTGEPSEGRFKAVVTGFVDPLVFEEGRLITVVGEVGTTSVGIIGEQEYQYPVLNAVGYHMWKETSDVRVESFAFSPFGFHYGFNRGFYNPWYSPWHNSHLRQRVRVIKHNGHSQGGVVTRSNSNSSVSATSRSGRTTSSGVRNQSNRPKDER